MKAKILWFTGMSGTGKSTLAKGVETTLVNKGYSVKILDGDTIRKHYPQKLTFSYEDIKKNHGQIRQMCQKYQDRDYIIVSVITPFNSSRTQNRIEFGQNYFEIYLHSDMDILIKRDTKGLYSLAMEGKIDNLIGFNSSIPFEEPESPDLKIDTGYQKVDQSINTILKYLGIKKIFCTLGPASLNQRVISRLDQIGVDLFRINLSHTSIEDLPKQIDYIKKYTSTPICLDLEGAQFRTGKLENNLAELEENCFVKIYREHVLGNKDGFTITPKEIITKVNKGDLIFIDKDFVILQVMDKNQDYLTTCVRISGTFGSNKAVNLSRSIYLPPISPKDKQSIKKGREMGVKHFALSFAQRSQDVEMLRDLAGEGSHIISKIESIMGIKNLQPIIDASDSILIDRGDLSREVPLEQIPFYQKMIIKTANQSSKPAYVATNLMETMIKEKRPTRAEVNDVVNTLLDGADGLVMAAETAIGDYPILCTNRVAKIIAHYQDWFENKQDVTNIQPISLLPHPHGNQLVQQIINPDMISKYQNCQRIPVDLQTMLDAYHISTGSFSPITGFMTVEQVNSVLKNFTLPNGTSWTL